MGAKRESFNLLNKYGRGNFFRKGLFGNKWARENVIGDTFRFILKFICDIFGHGKCKFMDWENGHQEQLCLRCLRYTGTINNKI